jgi:two-component system chemotaxis response regulator CheY
MLKVKFLTQDILSQKFLFFSEKKPRAYGGCFVRILVVDDNLAARTFVVSLLQRLGINHVVQVENGSQAVTRIRSDKNFDMIFMDWKMPVMSGPETISVLKFQGVQIPIVMMTAKSTTDDVQRMIKLGIKDYMVKPFNIEVLATKIKTATGRDIHDEAGSIMTYLGKEQQNDMDVEYNTALTPDAEIPEGLIRK